MAETKTFVDVAWVAKRLGSGQRHVYSLVANRAIPHYKIGRLLRFDPDEIEAWIEDNGKVPVV